MPDTRTNFVHVDFSQAYFCMRISEDKMVHVCVSPDVARAIARGLETQKREDLAQIIIDNLQLHNL